MESAWTGKEDYPLRNVPNIFRGMLKMLRIQEDKYIFERQEMARYSATSPAAGSKAA